MPQRRATIAVALLVLHTLGRAAAQPRYDIYHFSVLLADGSTQVVWPALPGLSAGSYQVQTASNAVFTADPTYVKGTPTTFSIQPDLMVLTVPAPSSTDIYYRVSVVEGGNTLASTQPAQPLDDRSPGLNSFVFQAPRGDTSAACTGTWINPCASIQDVLSQIDNAVTPFPMIWVGPGNYTGSGNQGMSFQGKAGWLRALVDADHTIIDCRGQDRAFSFVNAETNRTVLTGLTIINCGNSTTPTGGGVQIASASPVFESIKFINNTAAIAGGAVQLTSDLTLWPASFDNCLFEGNVAIAQSGGAINVENAPIIMTNSLFNENSCTAGSGAAFASIKAKLQWANLTFSGNVAGFTGGAIQAQQSTMIDPTVPMYNITCIGNLANGFAGAMNLMIGSILTFDTLNILYNVALFDVGGVQSFIAVVKIVRGTFIGNKSFTNVGAAKAIEGVLVIDQSTFTNNSAINGGAFEVYGTPNGSIPTELILTNSVVTNNSATGLGGAINAVWGDYILVANVSFSGNIAAQGGVSYCSAPNMTIEYSSMEGNTAQYGGAIYATEGCRNNVSSSQFLGNSAQETGGAIATADNVQMTITNSLFQGNGQLACASNLPPTKGGGAIGMGVEEFKAVSPCAAQPPAAAPTVITMANSTLADNIASNQGGAISIASGTINVQESVLTGNMATSTASATPGMGGGIYMTPKCSGAGCPLTAANLSNVSFAGNYAYQAGGGIYYQGNDSQTTLTYVGGALLNNTVRVLDHNRGGYGGGMFLNHNNFAIANLVVANNSAYYGGGAFISADLSMAVSFAQLEFQQEDNAATVGPAVYWVRTRSPQAEFGCTACTLPAGVAKPSVATEVVQAMFLQPPPPAVQTGKEVNDFTVGLVDYYDHTATTEGGWSCDVDGNTSDHLLVNVAGTQASVAQGVADFTHFVITAKIATSHQLEVQCTDLAGHSPYLADNSSVNTIALPPLLLYVGISTCPAGTEVAGNYTLCQDCTVNTFSFDGILCDKCPSIGASCLGGNAGIIVDPGFWRCNTTSPYVYKCPTSSACLGNYTEPIAYSSTSSSQCEPGYYGPLCAVCEPGYFKWTGACRTCGTNGQAIIMLAVSMFLLALLLVVLFVRDWGTFGAEDSNWMVKIKILITHIQLLALLKDYDVTWPNASYASLQWAEIINIGVTVTAPQCHVHGYNFYFLYVTTMAFPIILVALCVAVNLSAAGLHRLLERCREDGKRIAEGKLSHPRRQKVLDYLTGLKLRSWKNAFWLVTLLYPRCSMTALQMFSVKTLTGTGRFLDADYSIAVQLPSTKPDQVWGPVNAVYQTYRGVGAAMLVLFVLIIPATYFLILYTIRNRLDEPKMQAKFGFLYKGYSMPYWETLEMVRKLLVGAIPVFIPVQPYGSTQAVLAQLLFIFFLVVVTYARPYDTPIDNHLQMFSLVVLWLVLVCGSSLKWAGLQQNSASMRGVAAAEIFLSSFVVLAVMIAVIFQNAWVSRKVNSVRTSISAARRSFVQSASRRSSFRSASWFRPNTIAPHDTASRKVSSAPSLGPTTASSNLKKKQADVEDPHTVLIGTTIHMDPAAGDAHTSHGAVVTAAANGHLPRADSVHGPYELPNTASNDYSLPDTSLEPPETDVMMGETNGTMSRDALLPRRRVSRTDPEKSGNLSYPHTFHG